MEEDQYRDTYQRMNALRCHFEKSINARTATCAHGRRFNLADREGVACTLDLAQKRCITLLEILRQKGSFALGMPKVEGPLPHAKEIKVQMGSLLGLQTALHPEQTESDLVHDIQALISEGISRYGNLDQLPFEEIVKCVVKYEGRRRVERKPR